MRLGQLARKLALRPSQIVDYLASQEFFPEEGSNARLSNEITERVILHFAPERVKEIIGEEEKNPEYTSPIQDEPVIVNKAEEVIPVEAAVSPASNEAEEKPEVIKAPKVELSGLKVLGKIELPEPKKKPAPVSESAQETQEEQAKPEVKEKKPRIEERKNYSPRKESYKQRPSRNPIAEQREQKAREEEEKRKAKIERDKEKRTQYYLQRVKTGQPTKSVKIVSEPVESFTQIEVKPAPKTWWGKFLRWLNT